MSQKSKVRNKGALTMKTDLAVIDTYDIKQKETGNNRTRIILWVVSAIIIAQLLSLIPTVVETIGKLIR